MIDILLKLVALYGTLKNLHYSAHGPAFFSVHKLADEMSEHLLDYVDELQENYFMGQGNKTVNTGDLFSFSSAQIVDGTQEDCLRASLKLINETIDLLAELNTPAVEDIFSRLANELYKSRGFILQTLA